MPEREIQLIIEAVNRANDVLRDLQQANQRVADNVAGAWRSANGRMRNAQGRFVREAKSGFNEVEQTAKRTAQSMQRAFLGFVAGFGVTAGLARFARSTLNTTVQLESMRRGLEAVVGSAAEAERTLARLNEIAKLPGISLTQAIEASINLRSVKLSADLTERSLRAVGNALAIVGRPEELSGVVLGMTQMVSSGKVLQEEINQIASRIPQFRQAMIDAFGTARSEEIQQMGVSVEEFLGRTIAQLERLPVASETASTAISNFQNAVVQFQDAFGQVFLPAFTQLVNRATEAVNDLKESIADIPLGRGVSPAEVQMRQGEADSIRRLQEINRALPFLRQETGVRGFLNRLDPRRGEHIAQLEAERQALLRFMFRPFPEQAGEPSRPLPGIQPFPGFGGTGAGLEAARTRRLGIVGEDFQAFRRREQFLREQALRRPALGVLERAPRLPEGAFGPVIEAQQMMGTTAADVANQITLAWGQIASATDNMTVTVINAFLNLTNSLVRAISGTSGVSGFASAIPVIGAGVGLIAAFTSSSDRRRQDRDRLAPQFTRIVR